MTHCAAKSSKTRRPNLDPESEQRYRLLRAHLVLTLVASLGFACEMLALLLEETDLVLMRTPSDSVSSANDSLNKT